MRHVWMTLAGLLVAVVLLFLAMNVVYQEMALSPSGEPSAMTLLGENQDLVTVNTTRIGSDDAVETAVAVAQIVYPATEEENTPGAVVLVNQGSLSEVMLAASRVQHFPVSAPLLYVDENSIPEMTRNELLRLAPEGPNMDGNTQVYLVGTIGESVRSEVERMGFRARAFRAGDTIDLSEVLDTWTSTIHGDHRNAVVVANLDNLEPAIPSAFWSAHLDGMLEGHAPGQREGG